MVDLHHPITLPPVPRATTLFIIFLVSHTMDRSSDCLNPSLRLVTAQQFSIFHSMHICVELGSSVNAAMMLAIQLCLKSMDSLQNRLQPYSGATVFVSKVFKWTSMARYRSVDVDARCKALFTRSVFQTVFFQRHLWSFNVMCKQHHRNALNPFWNGLKKTL